MHHLRWIVFSYRRLELRDSRQKKEGTMKIPTEWLAWAQLLAPAVVAAIAFVAAIWPIA
jgi:hypothetical protein